MELGNFEKKRKKKINSQTHGTNNDGEENEVESICGIKNKLVKKSERDPERNSHEKTDQSHLSNGTSNGERRKSFLEKKIHDKEVNNVAYGKRECDTDDTQTEDVRDGVCRDNEKDDGEEADFERGTGVFESMKSAS